MSLAIEGNDVSVSARQQAINLGLLESPFLEHRAAKENWRVVFHLWHLIWSQRGAAASLDTDRLDYLRIEGQTDRAVAQVKENRTIALLRSLAFFQLDPVIYLQVHDNVKRTPLASDKLDRSFALLPALISAARSFR